MAHYLSASFNNIPTLVASQFPVQLHLSVICQETTTTTTTTTIATTTVAAAETAVAAAETITTTKNVGS